MEILQRDTTDADVLAIDRRCTARCLAACVGAVLRAGEEGSGLALVSPAAERHCGFHLTVAHGDRFRRLRLGVWHLLQVLRQTRSAASRLRHAVGTPLRTARLARERRRLATALKHQDVPRCTPQCLARCARAGLSAGLEGSGLGLSTAGYCRFHRSLLASESGAARRAIGWGLTAVRAPRAWGRRQVDRARALADGGRALAGRARGFEGRLEQNAQNGGVALRRRQALLMALVRALMARSALAVRARMARARPRTWWPGVRARGRAYAEARTRSAVASITELLVWAMPKPRPPIRSVVHVSLISHKQYMLSRLARNHGLKGTFLAINTYPGAHLKIGFDYEVPMKMDPFRRFLRSSWYLWTVLARHDVIHYHFNGFLFDDGTDLRVLQRMGKVVVVHYRGCDLRCRSINMAKNPELNVCQECSYPVGSCDTDYQRNKIAISRTHSDVRFVTTPDLLDFTDDAEHLPFIAPYAIDFSAIQPAPRTPGVFRVVTSSNHPALDGVRFVRDAVDRLAAEGVSIELIEIFRQPFYEALSLYKSADLYCGKLRMGYYNNANIESLMLGVPNMCFIREQYLDRIPDSPMILARPDNVYEKLREWVARPEELKRLGEQGPEFVRRHHQADQLMVRMIARYNQALERKAAAGYEAARQSSVLH